MPFCTNCGKKLEENEKCTCTAPEKTEPVAEEQKPKAPKSKKKFVLAGLVVVLVAVAAIAVSIVTAKPHMKPFNDFMAAINKENTSIVDLNKTLMPDFATKKYAKVYKELAKIEEYESRLESSSWSLENNYMTLTNVFGKWKLKFNLHEDKLLSGDELTNVQSRIRTYYDNNLRSDVNKYTEILNDKEKLYEYADNKDLTKRQAKSYLESLIAYYDVYKTVEVTDVYEIKGRFIIKAGRAKYDTDTLKFYIANVNGDWCLYSFREGSFEFDTEIDSYVYFIRNYLTSGRYFVNTMQ